MLDSLHIQNYRLFKDLTIEKLARVNLIAGKNNCGKTALLEALRILESDGDGTVINNICFLREEFVENREVSTYARLFYQSEYGDLMSQQIPISINELKIELIAFARPLYGLFCYHSYTKNKFDNEIMIFTSNGYKNPNDKAVFIPFVTESESNSKIWNSFVLTPHEEEVLSIVRQFEPRIKRLSIVENKAKVLLEGDEYPLPLKSFGDGINRLLSIALGLVKSQYKTLLLDEFEVGLHHGVQEQLWEIIFKYAQEWDIQVFVTTHSLDTVRSFSTVLDKNPEVGQYLRLQKSRMTGDVEAVVYSQKSLDIAIEDTLEMR